MDFFSYLNAKTTTGFQSFFITLSGFQICQIDPYD